MIVKFKILIILCLFIFSGVVTSSYAQLYTLDINKFVQPFKSKATTNSRTESDLTLSLPFWDDFSLSRNGQVDTLLWKIGENIEVSAGVGLNPPTFNVASFNGIRIDGSPYSFNAFENGDADTLTSHFIDLSGLSDNDKNTVFLSLYHQKQGNGELPDSNDGIRIEFMNSDSVWVPGFPTDSLIGSNFDDSDFHQIIMKVEGEEFFHDEFRFQIIYTGRQTGPYDTWNIDYVYLDTKRNINDLNYADRSFTRPPTSPWKNFNSLPMSHFLSDKNNLLSTMSSRYFDLGNQILSTEVSNYTLEGHVAFIREDTLVNYIDIIEFDNSDISNQYDITFTTQNKLDVSTITDNTTELSVVLKLHADTGEAQNQSVNTLVNDTIYAHYQLKDYYAYDDGTAEKAAGVNSLGNQIAYQFPYAKTALKDSILTGVDIYFPQSIGHDQFNKTIKFKIWDDNNGLPGEEIYVQTTIIPKIDTLNKFVRYNFSQELDIADTFYLGWEQLTVDRIYVGLDKNTESGDRIYYKLVDEWLQNDGDISGSLMMRPVFGEVKIPDPADTVTGVYENKLNSIKIYPNPSSHYCIISGVNNTNIKIYDINGRQIQIPSITNSDEIIYDFGSLPNGVYLIKLIDKKYIRTEKFILRK